MIHRSSKLSGWTASTFALAIAVMASAGWAAPPASKTTDPKMDGKALLQERSSKLEDEIAQWMERRAESPPAGMASLELQIDLRIVAHWLLSRGAEAPPESEVPSAAFLRANSVLSAAEEMSQRLEKSAAPLTVAQMEALARLHQLTYKLQELKSVGQMDETCRDLAGLLMAASGTAMPAKGLPIMRPTPVETSHGPGNENRSLTELSTAARQAAVSAPLRRQLAALAAEATTATADAKRQDEANILRGMLARTVSMAEGLQQGAAVEATTRNKIEVQLTDGLALFLDVRTRGAGASKVEQLRKYHETLERVRRMHLPDAMRDRLAPVFAYSQQHPDDGPKLLDTLEHYLQLGSEFDARKEAAALPPAQKRVVAELQKQFAAHRQSFLDDVGAMDNSTGLFSGGPEQLRAHVSQMQQTWEWIGLVDGIPAALQSLAIYKPRPTGGLDRRALVSANSLGGIVQTPSQHDAQEFLMNLQTMARIARQLAEPLDIPADVAKLYARSRVAEFSARRSEMLTELASLAAAGKEVDRGKLQRLDGSQAMVDALRSAAAAEAAMKQSDLLDRWVDWDVTPAELNAALGPYRTATASAVDSFSEGNTAAVEHWNPAQQRYGPLIALVKDLGNYVAACKAMPADWPAEAARLTTPMEGKPFATERWASLVIAAWMRSGDDHLADSVAARLRQEQGRGK